MSDRPSHVLADSGNPFLDIFREGLFAGIGRDAAAIKSKPLIAIANSHTEFTAGHAHLARLAQSVKEGVHKAGGECVEFNVPAPCDGMAMGHDGMRYVLAQRDLIADLVETHVRSQRFDGLVMIAGCDKINPAMMMAAARLDLPAIYLAAGPGQMEVRDRGGYRGSIDHGDYLFDLDLLKATASCATCGACEIMGTANTFQCLAEVMGICLPGSSNVPAFHGAKLRYAELTGKRIVELVQGGTNFRRILDSRALRNAARMTLAIGGSTNALLHLPAIAQSAGLELPLSVFEELSRSTPTLLAMSPNGPHGIIDLWRAGGMPAVIKRMADDLELDAPTVAGVTLRQVAEAAKVLDAKVIPPKEQAFRADAAIAVLRGNLAPEGAVVKQSGVSPGMLVCRGRALCFDTEEAALEAIRGGRIKAGHVVVLRYQGPRGGPGMPEMLGVTLALKLNGLADTALITDGRFSGATSGPCVGHVCPEAASGGLIALVQDGDEISIDIPARRLQLHVDDAELAARKAQWAPLEKPVPHGYMQRYRKHVLSAAQGALLD